MQDQSTEVVKLAINHDAASLRPCLQRIDSESLQKAIQEICFNVNRVSEALKTILSGNLVLEFCM